MKFQNALMMYNTKLIKIKTQYLNKTCTILHATKSFNLLPLILSVITYFF